MQQSRATLAAERKYQADLRRIESANRKRREEHPHVGGATRRQESDDEVRGNIPPDMVALFERVKRSIKGSERMTRTEAFLKYAEEHPAEVLHAIDDKTDQIIRDLEKQEREARRSLSAPPPRRKFTAEELAETPF